MKTWVIKSGGEVVAITTKYELVLAITKELDDFELIVTDHTKRIRWAVNEDYTENKIMIEQAF